MITAEQLKIEIANLDAQIERNDKSIEDAERRQSLRRQYGDRLFARRLEKVNQLEREEALLIKPQPRGVKAGSIDI